MLTFEEKEVVRSELRSLLLPIAAQLQKQYIQIIFGNAREMMTAIDLSPATASAYSATVVRVCLEARWNNVPQSFLELLLTHLIDNGNIASGNVNLMSVRDRVRLKIDPNLDSLRSSWITADQPLFGRLNTRPRIRALLDGSDKPILLVQGDKHSGKSYTGEWLDYLAGEERFDFAIAVESLDKGDGPTTSPDILAESLVSKLGRPRPHVPMPDEKKPRWEKRLCNWIIEQALAKNQKVWIVLDGFDTPNLDRRTAALIQEMASAVLSGEANRKVRLILIDFQSNLTQVQSPRKIPDTLEQPSNIGPRDLEPCLRQHLTDMGRDFQDDFVSALADTLYHAAELLGQDPSFAHQPKLKRLNIVVYNFRQQDLALMGRA